MGQAVASVASSAAPPTARTDRLPQQQRHPEPRTRPQPQRCRLRREMSSRHQCRAISARPPNALLARWSCGEFAIDLSTRPPSTRPPRTRPRSLRTSQATRQAYAAQAATRTPPSTRTRSTHTPGDPVVSGSPDGTPPPHRRISRTSRPDPAYFFSSPTRRARRRARTNGVAPDFGGPRSPPWSHAESSPRATRVKLPPSCAHPGTPAACADQQQVAPCNRGPFQ